MRRSFFDENEKRTTVTSSQPEWLEDVRSYCFRSIRVHKRNKARTLYSFTSLRFVFVEQTTLHLCYSAVLRIWTLTVWPLSFAACDLASIFISLKYLCHETRVAVLINFSLEFCRSLEHGTRASRRRGDYWFHSITWCTPMCNEKSQIRSLLLLW